MKKTVLCLLLCVTVCAAMSSFACYSAEEDSGLPYPTESRAEISIQVPVTELEVGDTVYVQIGASDVTDLYAFSMTLQYDEEAFAYSDIQSGFADETTETVVQQSDGRVVYAYTNIADGSQREETLATLMLTAKQTGTVEVSLDKLTLVYSDLSYTDYIHQQKVSITIGKQEETKPPSGGGSGSGPSGGGTGGRRPGGTITISGGGYTSTTAPAPSSTPIPAPTPVPAPAFTDLESVPWAQEAIAALVDKGVLQGYDGGIFLPDAPVSRAEFAKMICAAFQLAATEDAIPVFPDVAADAWYAEPVTICAQHGILNGDEAGFRPEDSITRAEMAAVIERAVQQTEKVLMPVRSNINFSDEAAIAPFAVGAVDLLYMAGIIDGDTAGCFRPEDGLSRAEAAKVIYEVTK